MDGISPAKLPGIDIQAMAFQTLGGVLGGPVGSILGGAAGANMPQAKDMVSNMCTMFDGATTPRSQVAQRPQAFSVNVSITIMNNPLQAATQPAAAKPAQTHFAKAPMVGGEGDWPGFNKAVNDRITGSDANKNALGMDGNIWANGKGNTAEKAAVGWAMQQDDRLRFDADRKQFYTTNSDGSTKDVCSLNDMVNVINQNGGANQNNGVGYKAVGSYIDGLLANQPAASGSPAAQTQQAAGGNPMQQIMQILQQLLQALGGQLGGAAGGMGSQGVGAGTAPGQAWTEDPGNFNFPAASQTAGGSGAGEASGPAASGSEGGLHRLNQRMEHTVKNMIDEGLALKNSPNPEIRQKGMKMLHKAAKLYQQLQVMENQERQMSARQQLDVGTELRNNTRGNIGVA